jgi:taurine dioxygenase
MTQAIANDAAAAQRFRVLPSTAPLGNEVVGLDISQPLDEATFAQLRRAYDEHSVLVFRGQRLTPEQHIRFSRGFGELEIHVMAKYLLPGHPEIFRVSNIMENGQRIGGSGEFWHTDLSYVAQPSRGSLLYSIEVPVRDGVVLGDTLFASTAAAYDGLSAGMKKRLEGLVGVHRFGDVYKQVALQRPGAVALTSEQLAKVPEVRHPVVKLHPVTGRKCLFVNEGFTAAIEGMPEDESRVLLRELFDHTTRPEFVYRHNWRVGDLVMWDNYATVHRGTGDYSAEERRMMHRTTLKGQAPRAATG